MRHFTHLRMTPWEPRFAWMGLLGECADRINSYHEDYPRRVRATLETIQRGNPPFSPHAPGHTLGPDAALLHAIHRRIFRGAAFRGKFRTVNVRVGAHRPPDWKELRNMMAALTMSHQRILTVQDILDWYWDFETIHPYEDGNGRVGGVVVAVYSHALEPEKGWLTVCQ